MKRILAIILAIFLVLSLVACNVKTTGATKDKENTINIANKLNEYILNNSYVWGNNVPDDINYNLPLIE